MPKQVNEYNDYDIDMFATEQESGDEMPVVIPTANDSYFDEFDELVIDTDFSGLAGKPFKKSFSKLNQRIAKKSVAKRKTLAPPKPLTKSFSVETKATIFGRTSRKMGKVIVPDDRPVIVENVNKFILSEKPEDNSIRNIGYYNGKKLQELVLIFNNDSALDFNLSLFNPSMVVDYLQSTGLNLNDKIQVASGSVSYSDVMFNILGNPLLIRNAKFVLTGPRATEQQSVSLQIQDKFVNGVTEIIPMNLSLQIDTMQVEGNTISFDISRTINRAFIPDGMDVIGYRVLAGNTVTMCFYYEQKSLKKLMYPEARKRKIRLDRQ